MNDSNSYFESRVWRFAIAALIFGLFVLAIWSLNRELTHFRWGDMWASIRGTSPAKLGLAALFSVLSYAMIAVYFDLSLRYAGKPLSWKDTVSFSLIITTFSANLGAGAVTSNLLRARLLSARGYTLGEGVKSAVAHAVFLIFGQTLITGLVLAWQSPLDAPVYLPSTRALGWFLLLSSLAFSGLILARTRPLKLRNWLVPMPSRPLFVAGLGLGMLDWLFASTVVALLMPPDHLAFGHLLAVVLTAYLAAVISHVPGGLGVFEAVVVTMMPKGESQSALIGSLLIYRIIYLLIPFALSVILYATHEIRARMPQAPLRVVGSLWKRLSLFASELMAMMIFASGVVLLISGSTPVVPERLHLLRGMIPLALLEASHFLASVTGIFLIVLAWAVRRRVNAAWWVTVILLVLAMAFSLGKGLDYEETLFLGVVLAIAISLRRQFYRHASLFARRESPQWWILVLSVVIATMWIGFLVHRHVEYRNDLWWQFAFSGDAPRFLRASVGIAVVLLTVACFQLFRPASSRKDERLPGPPDPAVSAIIAASPDAETGLAWLGDKRFMLSPDKRAALMYGVWGRSRVILGDPFGSEDAWEGLLWNVLDECDLDGQRPVFYGVSEENAHHYLDIGFQLFKVGEEARVPVQSFSLDGSRRKDLRNTVSKLERQGCLFGVIPKGEFRNHAAELRTVSDAWLTGKNAREKSFSLGCFDEAFLDHFPIAVIRLNGAVVAFANLLHSGTGKTEFSIDLMRFDPAKAPNGTMQFLFTKLILWGKEEGYEWFSLGVAPLSGLENRSAAPLWHKIGGAIFRHAEHFYNFQGLRAYKEKFDPVWISTYVAVRSGRDMPAAMFDSSALVSGGIAGMIRK